MREDGLDGLDILHYHYPEQAVLVIDPRYILASSVQRICYNYQATKLVNCVKDIRPTWAKNKVPILLLETEADLVAWKKEEPNCKFINIPESAASFDLNTGSEQENDPFIEFCHSQCGIECGEYITGKKIIVGKEGCFLCEIANGLGDWKENRVEYNVTTKKLSNIVIMETEHYILKIEYGHFADPTKGQLMAMICAKDHIMSTASIPDEIFEEYRQFCRDVEDFFKKIYGEDTPVVFFEHGSSDDGAAAHKRSIVHHHTHVIVGVRMGRADLERVKMRPINDIREVRGKKYLSYQEGVNGQLWVADDPEVFVPRQYPRKVFAYILGISYRNSNWRVEPYWDNIVKAFEIIYNHLRDNWDEIPERIQMAMRAFYEAYPRRRMNAE